MTILIIVFLKLFCLNLHLFGFFQKLFEELNLILIRLIQLFFFFLFLLHFILLFLISDFF